VLRAVFDTNVYISALLVPGSKAEDAYLHAVRGKVRLFTSPAILTELAKKLREKFLWDDGRIVAALKHISRVAEVVKPQIRITLLKDKPDNRILECARAASADIIVTGDKHLLGLKEYEGMGIAKVADFLRVLPGREEGRGS